MAFQGDSIYWVDVEKVVPNPFQPRREFDQNKLQELADSIRMYGVLQPLTVTRNEVQQENGTFYTEYELIAGERRLRASKLAGSAQVPVIIREGEQNEQEKLELAIIENLQREDLNAVDRALAFKQLAEVFKLSHAQVAQKVGRSREYVSNSIRLLGLPEHMLNSLKRAEMMEGHARTLLMLNDRPEEQEVVYKEVLLKKLSVREVERIVRKIATDKVRKKGVGEFDEYLIEFEKQFTETLGTRVQIQKTDFGGKLTIDYFSTEDLEAILKRVRDEEKKADVPTTSETAARIEAHTPLSIVTPTAPVEPKPVPVLVQPQPPVFPAEPRESFQREVVNREPVNAVTAQSEDSPVHAESASPWSFMKSAQPIAPSVSVTPQQPVVNHAQPISSVEPSQPATQPLPINPVVVPEPVVPPVVAPASPSWSPFGFRNQSPAEQSFTHRPVAQSQPATPVVSEPEPVQPTPTPVPEKDESDLYSMKNFGI